jgi:Raf kinase inhibitor-like YbhB/YbcL family protein
MRIWSPAFADKERIPDAYARDGGNVSPPLEWSDVPERTQELALVFENVTPETQQPFANWLVYGIAPNWDGLPEGFQHKRAPKSPVDVLQGSNDIGNIGYDGPLGSVGRKYRYRFRLLALDKPLELERGADRDTVLSAASGHTLAEAELDAAYERSP